MKTFQHAKPYTSHTHTRWGQKCRVCFVLSDGRKHFWTLFFIILNNSRRSTRLTAYSDGPSRNFNFMATLCSVFESQDRFIHFVFTTFWCGAFTCLILRNVNVHFHVVYKSINLRRFCFGVWRISPSEGNNCKLPWIMLGNCSCSLCYSLLMNTSIMLTNKIVFKTGRTQKIVSCSVCTVVVEKRVDTCWTPLVSTLTENGSRTVFTRSLLVSKVASDN